MRAKSMLLIVIALGCGLVASIAISQVMERSGSNGKKLETVPIYVATADIDVNEQLASTNVRLEDWPKSKVPEGAITSLDDIKDRFARTRLYEGEPILQRKLADAISGPAIKIPDGFRVCSLKVRMDTAVSNLVRPGDRVDIFGYFRANSDIPKTGTREILRNVRVFAVNSETEQMTDEDGETIVAKTVSVLVKQDQVARLMLAAELGTLRLALRRPNEEEDHNNQESATIESLFGTHSESADDDKPNNTVTSGLAKFLTSFARGSRAPAAPTPNIPVAPPAPPEPKWEMTVLTPTGGTEFTWSDENSLPDNHATAGSAAAAAPSAFPPAGWLPAGSAAADGDAPTATSEPAADQPDGDTAADDGAMGDN